MSVFLELTKFAPILGVVEVLSDINVIAIDIVCFDLGGVDLDFV